MQRVWSTYLENNANTSSSGLDAAAGSTRALVNRKDTNSLLTDNHRSPCHRCRHSSFSLCFDVLSWPSPSSSPQKMDPLPHRRTSSLASSQRHILAAENGRDMVLEPPSAPFTGLAPTGSPKGSMRSDNPISASSDAASIAHSLSVNYLPSKFSRPISPGLHKRKGGKGGKGATRIPKQGGGREAFRSGESRMPGENDEDYDGVDVSGGKWKPKLRWNKFKWIMFFSNFVVSAYSLIALIFCLLTWFNVWTHADIIRVGNRGELVVSTLAAGVGIITSLIGWAGILLNNRGFLAVYTFLLWITFGLICVPGYITYKKRTFNLEGKVNAQWSRDLGLTGRLRIQNQLNCCGYFSPFVEATVSQLCYARSLLPGCKSPFLHFERTALERWYAVAFGIVPFQLIAILAALLCSNHVTFRFGKGMMPKAYRLSMNSMAIIMDNYANKLAEQYGTDVASELVSRSRSNIQLDSMPSLHYGVSGSNTPLSTPGYSTGGGGNVDGGQYASLGGTADEYPKRI
ncbi:hypothetical protein EW145_g5127 [Phellinidium pouzarii]|uniref:Tetraspanin Tsp2 n=1 Tax=Phellinidium pouzarii TaxID=167371 RepID=A0A4V3XC95_9AGAM|nr:hypothetical protein EW145_g5127 [Phellinidium pouzarii]